MALLPVILGGGEIGGVTPASIAAQRAVADALANKGTPKTLGEGIASLGDAIAYRAINARANKEQQAGQSSADADFQSLYGGGDGTATADPTQLSPVDAPAPRPTQIGDFSASPLAAAPNAATPDLVDFTAGEEGFTPTAQPDGSQWSDGYGTKATPAEMAGQPISPADARARLQQELGTADSYVSSLPGADKLNPNQREALDDAAYNLGSFQPGLTGAIASGDLADVPAHLAQYTGSWSPANQSGLQNRRNAEIALWNTPAGNGAPPAPVPAPGAPIDAEASLATADPNAGAPTLAPPQSDVSPAVANVAQALQATGQPTAPSAGVASVAQAMGGQGAPAAPAVAAGPATAMGNLPPSTGVATVASALAPRPAAPAAPGPAVPSIPPAQLQAAQRILSNPFSTAQQQAQATAVLTQARQQADPEYQLKLRTEQTQLDQLQHPAMSIQTLPGGTIIGIDTRTGQSQVIRQGTSATRPFTDQDRATFSIPPDQAGYMDATGAPHYLGSSTLAQTEQAVNAGPAPIDPSDPAYTTKPVAGGLTQAAVDQRALSLLATGQTPPQGRTGIAGEQNVAISNRMATFGGNPALNKADYKALGGALSDQTDYLNTVQRAFSTAEATLGTVTDWMNQNNINPSAYPDFNSLINFASTHGLDVGPIRGFQSQVAQLRAEYAMVLARGGQITDSTRAAANEIVPDNVTPTDLLTIASRLNVDGQKAIDAGTQQIAQIHKQLAGIAPAPGSAPTPGAAAPQAPPTTTAPPPGAAAPSALPPGIIRMTPDGVGVPKTGFPDAGTPPPGYPGTPDAWKFVPPNDRHYFTGGQ